MWALKLGGSILHCAADDPLVAARERLFETLRRQPARFLLVPGGGHHADAVRAAQQEDGFDDDTAHLQALAAMDASASDCAALLRGTARVITRLQDAPATLAAGVTPVWAPHDDLAGDHTLPRNWYLTSDSIAAVAARRLGLAGVALLKSCAVPEGASAEALVVAGIVDAEWPRQSAGLQTMVLGPSQWIDLAGVLGPGA